MGQACGTCGGGGSDAYRALVGNSEKRPLWRLGSDGRKTVKWMGQQWLYPSGSGEWQVVGLCEHCNVVQQINTHRARYFRSVFIHESIDEVPLKVRGWFSCSLAKADKLPSCSECRQQASVWRVRQLSQYTHHLGFDAWDGQKMSSKHPA